MKILMILIGIGIIGYMKKMDDLSVIDRPLFWNDLTLTFGVLLGLVMIGIGIFI
jgi:hypothetical protein